MALFRLTLKSTHHVNGLHLEKGMSVEVASSYSNPLTTNGGHEVIAAFQRVYGLDLSKAKGYLSSAYFEVKKLN
ncbi:MAG: DUF6140 family protein [Janthinobacterium lividum]